MLIWRRRRRRWTRRRRGVSTCSATPVKVFFNHHAEPKQISCAHRWMTSSTIFFFFCQYCQPWMSLGKVPRFLSGTKVISLRVCVDSLWRRFKKFDIFFFYPFHADVPQQPSLSKFLGTAVCLRRAAAGWMKRIILTYGSADCLASSCRVWKGRKNRWCSEAKRFFWEKKKGVETNDSNTAQRETESCFIHLKQPVEGQFTHSTIYRLLYRSKGGI